MVSIFQLKELVIASEKEYLEENYDGVGVKEMENAIYDCTRLYHIIEYFTDQGYQDSEARDKVISILLDSCTPGK
jgi:hypothetical protein